MSTEPVTSHLQPGDGIEDSTQRGFTSWLLISCVFLTITTSFVFGWGLAAPNMYNDFTEPFLKGHDPCISPTSTQPRSTVTASTYHATNDNHVVKETDMGNTETAVGENNNSTKNQSKTLQNKNNESFNFVRELIKGIPQTIFLIGAFIGAITGPFWATFIDRKRTVFANYIFCFASSLCTLLSYYFGTRWLFYLSRLLLGYQGNNRSGLRNERRENNYMKLIIFRRHDMCCCTTVPW